MAPVTRSSRKAASASSPSPTLVQPLDNAKEYLIDLYSTISAIDEQTFDAPKNGQNLTEQENVDQQFALITFVRSISVYAELRRGGKTALRVAICGILQSCDASTREVATRLRDAGSPGNRIKSSRLEAFVTRFGWHLLSVCAFSPRFREICSNPADNTLWAALCDLILSYAHSIELFARTRNLPWEGSLTLRNTEWCAIFIQIRGVIEPYLHGDTDENSFSPIARWRYGLRHDLSGGAAHPHEWALSETNLAQRPEFTYRTGTTPTTVRQVNIESSEVKRGYTWINRNQWPIRDPRYRGFDYIACMACGRQLVRLKKPCNCTFADLSRMWKNLDEHRDHEEEPEQDAERFNTTPKLLDLVHYQGRGIGVRALQNFEEGEIIAEYTGQLYPKWTTSDNGEVERTCAYPNDAELNYRLEQRLAPRTNPVRRKRKSKTPSPQSGKECNAMIIDSAVRGNWTRYMNHSCAFSTRFECANVGNKKYTVVVATRDINFGEELTTDYGLEFWEYTPYNCACGDDVCKYKTAKTRKYKGNSNTALKARSSHRTGKSKAVLSNATPSKSKEKPGTNSKQNGKQVGKRKRDSDDGDEDDEDDDEPQKPIKTLKLTVKPPPKQILTAPKKPTTGRITRSMKVKRGE